MCWTDSTNVATEAGKWQRASRWPGTVEGVIDLRRLRDDENYRLGAIRKGIEPDLIDATLVAEDRRLESLGLVEGLRAEANAASKDIGRAAPEERQDKIEAASALKSRLSDVEATLNEALIEVRTLALQIPNPADPSVPDGGEDDFRVEAEVGQPRESVPMDHAEIGEKLGLFDTERAVRMSGSRFAYLMGDAVLIQFAIVQWTLQKLVAKGFVPAVVPVLVREQMMIDAGYFPTDRHQVYAVDGDDLFLTGTSEVGLAGMHDGERLDAADLPARYAGYSTCFRREAGTYGKDTRGIFRVHQFDKVEMFTYCHPDRSWDELEVLRATQEEIVSELEIPYRVITVAAGDLGAPAAKKYDLEAWLPSENRYREITSCSNYTDFSARRMQTRFKGDGESALVHTLNGTASAIGRTILFLLENHVTDDGEVPVPAVLRPYCGLESIRPR